MEVTNDGLVYYWPSIQAHFFSIFDITYFPFDTQLVYIHLCAWTQTTDDLVLHVGRNMNVHNFNLQWTVLNSDNYKYTESFDGFMYDTIIYKIFLKRNPRFYVVTVILPTCLLSLLSLLIFHIPSSSGDRMSYGITLLLSFTVLQLMVADSLPKTSTISLIGIISRDCLCCFVLIVLHSIKLIILF